jgi:Na+-translocating membrane potential-generating system (MpsC)
MTGTRRNRLPISLSARISSKLGSLWTQYADQPPSEVRTEIHGNMVSCRLFDAVGAFNRSMIAPQTHDTLRGVGKLTNADYKRDAIAAVVRLTRQRVTSFVSSHDRDTDVATEVFTLEPSLGLGRRPSLAQVAASESLRALNGPHQDARTH